MRDDPALQFESRISRVVCCSIIRSTSFIPAPRNMRRTQAGDRFHRAEDVIENVAPVAEHVHDQSAAVCFAVIPRRPLSWNGVAFEDPITKFAADGKYPAEESEVTECLQLQQSGQPKLILHH